MDQPLALHPDKKKLNRITLLERDEFGALVPETLWKAKKKKSKVSRDARPVDRIVRSAAKAQKSFASTLLKRHRKSNRKRKNGGLWELGPNVFRASRRAIKAAR